MNQLRDLRAIERDVTRRAAAAEFVALGRLLLETKGDMLLAAKRAENTGLPQHIVRIAQHNVGSRFISKADSGQISAPGGSPATWGAELSYAALANAFLESLRDSNVFDAALPFMRRAPLKTRFPIVEGGATGNIVAEAAAKGITTLDTNAAVVEPLKAAATVVVSNELLKFGGEMADTILGTELRAGVSAATDAKFTADLIAATTPTASSGNFLYDLQLLLSAIEGNAASVYFAVVEPAAAKQIATAPQVGGEGPAFPSMTRSGGTVAGVTVLASDALDAGEVVAFDARQIAADGGSIALDVSRHAMLDLAGGSSPAFSTWQKNSTAMRAERWFGYSILRESAVASLSGADYVGESPS